MREVRGNAKCPCGLGKRYASCCKKKKFQWLVDESGAFHKQVPLTSEAVKVLKAAEADFQRYFERRPDKKSDPVFLAKYLISEQEMERQMVEAMVQAGIRPHIIHAFQRTGGLLLTRENEALMTAKDVRDWDAAVDEYRKLSRRPPKPPLLELLAQGLEDEFNACLVCLGYVLEYGLSDSAEQLASSSEFFSIDEYVLLCATKSIKTLRSVKVLVENNIGADALALSRHLLENYLHIVCSLAKPEMIEHLVDAHIGLKLGTHEFAKRSGGKPDSRRIIRKTDGAVFLGHVSHFKMAESSPYSEDAELFDYLYSFLSEYTHPSFAGFELVMGQEGTLDPLSNELRSEAMFFSICLSAMILDQLRCLPTLSERGRSDVATVVRRIDRRASALLDEIFRGRQLPGPYEVLRRRMASLGASD